MTFFIFVYFVFTLTQYKFKIYNMTSSCVMICLKKQQKLFQSSQTLSKPVVIAKYCTHLLMKSCTEELQYHK